MTYSKKTNPIENAQEDDKTVVDGYLSPGEIVERGKLAAVNTIETLKQMYPHSPELKLKEEEMMANEELNKTLRAIEKENRENISAYYVKHKIKESITEIKNQITKLNEEYEKSKHTNLLYQKEQKIKELEALINKTRKDIE